MWIAILIVWGILGFIIGGSVLVNLKPISNKQIIFVATLMGPVGWIGMVIAAIGLVFKIIWRMLK
jgi:hypothetical protein